LKYNFIAHHQQKYPVKRKIRAHLLQTFEEQWQEEVIRGPSPAPISSAEMATRIS
jgi:hypothetical protein